MNDVAEWCILRTSGGRTIALAKSLEDAGFVVWTPVSTTRRSVRRGVHRVMIERTAPIAPTFVFAAAEHLHDLAREARRPFSRHPSFSVFQRAGRAPLIGEASIAGMRDEEAGARASIFAERERVAGEERRRERAAAHRTEQQRRKALRAERRELPAGLQVIIDAMPAMAGLAGTVVECDGTSALVAFGGALVMKIEAWQLIPTDVGCSQPVPA